MNPKTLLLPSLLLLAASPAARALEESGALIASHPEETVSASEAKFEIEAGSVTDYRGFAIGIDDTLNTYAANATSLISGRSFANGPAFASCRIETVDDGSGISVIRIRHNGRFGARPPGAGSPVERVWPSLRSRNQLIFSAYRVSGNQAPVSIRIRCQVSDCILDSPDANTSASELAISLGYHLLNPATGTILDSAFGAIEFNRSLGPPVGAYNFSGIVGDSDLGAGRHQVSAGLEGTSTVLYQSRLRLVDESVATGYLEAFAPADSAPWEIDMNAGIVFEISSADPNVRFLLHGKENPAPGPDLAIGTSPARWRGDDLRYPGPIAAQTVAVRQPRRGTRILHLLAQNDGPDIAGGGGDNAIRLRAPRRVRRVRLSYLLSTPGGFRNVTAPVSSGSFLLPGHFPGYGENLRIVSRSDHRRPGGRKSRRKTVSRVNVVARSTGGIDVVQGKFFSR